MSIESLKPASIRSRLILWLGVGLLLMCAAFLWSVYDKTLHEAAELIDGDLVSVTRLGMQTVVDQAQGAPLASDSPIGKHDYETPMVLQAWSADGALMVHIGPPAGGVPAPKAPGFADFRINAKQWRSFAAFRPKEQLWIRSMVAADARNALATDVAENMLKPGLILIPVMLLFVWGLVTYALRPLARFSSEIERQDINALSSSALRTGVTEMKPVVDAINSLVGRLRDVRERELSFVADAAHELRTPLAGIKLHAEVALTESDPERLRAALVHIEMGSKHAADLVNQLLGLAKFDAVQQLDFKPLAVADVVRRVFSTLLPLADDRGVNLVADGNIELSASGDESALEIMLRNLVANAINHSPVGGRVTVTVAQQDNRNDQLILSVADEGCGIDEADRTRIFERFSRLPGTQTPGSGLGLAIVSRIVGLHEGTIRVESSVNGGALFIVTLRVVQSS
jgi:signal transduction histidine kinase